MSPTDAQIDELVGDINAKLNKPSIRQAIREWLAKLNPKVCKWKRNYPHNYHTGCRGIAVEYRQSCLLCGGGVEVVE